MRDLLDRAIRRLIPFLPRRWRLPLLVRLDQWAGVEPESRWLAEIGPCRGTAIDVGANYGLYSYALCRHYPRVIAFEPNPRASELLKAWNSPQVQIVQVGVSSQPGMATLFVPCSDKVEWTGWGSLDPNNSPDAKALVQRPIELRTLDSFGFTDVGLIKIDAEGHELEVLQGAAETIRRQKPYLLVEVRSRASEVRALLSSWGYEETTLEKLTGVPGSPANFVFVPDVSRETPQDGGLLEPRISTPN